MQNPNEFTGSIIDVHIINHQEMVQASKLWDLSEYQIQNGPFKGFIKAIHTPSLQLGYVFRSRGVVLQGKPPKNCYMIAYLYVEEKGKITHNGLAMNPNELLVLEGKDQVDVMSSQGYNSLSIAVNTEFFDREYKNYFNDPFTYDQLHKRIQLKKNMVMHFKQSLINLLSHAMKDPVKSQEDTEFLQDIQKRIMQILFQSLDMKRNTKSPLKSEKHANMLRIYLNQHLTENLTLKQISQDLHMSERTIRHGFNKLFGMSPKKYLLNYRLGKVHNALRTNDVEKVTVKEISKNHSFSHAGKFSKKYRDMFGENPQDTLKRKP